jgi:DNA primase
MEYDHKGFLDALGELAGRAGMEVPDTRDPNAPVRESQQHLYDMLESAAKYFEQQLRAHRDKAKAVNYFKKRGLTGEIAKHYRLGYAPAGWDNLLGALGSGDEARKSLLTTGLVIKRDDSARVYDAMRDRVIFPIRDFRGRVIAFGGRVLTDEKPKYLNSPESPVFHKGQELYGLFEARQAPGKLERVIVVEGYMDVVALAQYGITYAVATLGTATSTTHVERLFRLVPEIVFCFDGDAAGLKAAWRALESALPALQDGKSASFLFLPADEDPDTLVRKEGKDRFVDRMINEAEPLADFLFRHLSEGLKLESLEGRSRLAMLAKPLVATLPDGLYREMLLGRLAELTRLDAATLRAAVLETAPLPAQRSEPPPGPAAPEVAPTPQRQARRQPRPPAPRLQTVSLEEKAVRLLLQDPKQASLATPEELLSWGLAPDVLLVQLIELLQSRPGISTPALLGVWQGSPQGEQLAELAANEFLTPSTGVDREFRDVLRGLRLNALEQELRTTTEKLAYVKDGQEAASVLEKQRQLKRDIEQMKRGN